MLYYYPKPEFQQVGISVLKWIFIAMVILYTICSPEYFEMYLFILIYTFLERNMPLFYAMLVVVVPRVLGFLDFYFIIFEGKNVYKYRTINLVIQLLASVIVGLFFIIYVAAMEDDFNNLLKDPLFKESVMFLICNCLSYALINSTNSSDVIENSNQAFANVRYAPIMPEALAYPQQQMMGQINIPMQNVASAETQKPQASPVFVPYYALQYQAQ